MKIAVALFFALLTWLAPAQAQTTQWYCSSSSGSLGTTGTYSHCPTVTAPAPSPGAACAAIIPSGTPSGYQTWSNRGFASNSCQFRAYLVADVAQDCWPSCLASGVVFTNTAYSAAKTIHVFAIFTPDAKTYIEAHSGTESSFFSAELAKLTAANTASYTQITWVNSGFVSGAGALCCGTQTHFAYNGSGNPGAVVWAQANNDILVERDNSGADITIIFGRYASDVPFEAGGAVTQLPGNAAINGFIGVNVDKVDPGAPFYIDPAITATAVGTLMGAGQIGASPYIYKTGTSSTDCTVWWTIGSVQDNLVPTGTTATKYFWPGAGDIEVMGSGYPNLGPLPIGDFASGSDSCAVPIGSYPPLSGYGNWQNNGYGGGSCQFRRYRTGDPTCQISCMAMSITPSTHVVPTGDTFACGLSNLSSTGAWSMPDHQRGGVWMGDGNSYGASTVNFNAAVVSTFHNATLGIH